MDDSGSFNQFVGPNEPHITHQAGGILFDTVTGLKPAVSFCIPVLLFFVVIDLFGELIVKISGYFFKFVIITYLDYACYLGFWFGSLCYSEPALLFCNIMFI